MDTFKALATIVAFAASSAAPALAAAATGGHGAVAIGAFGRTSHGPDGRSGLRPGARSRFDSGLGGPGFAYADFRASQGLEHERRSGRRDQGWGYSYSGYPYLGTGYDYGDAPGPGPYGPPPYGGDFGEGYRPLRRVSTTIAAPLTYGSGAHDGAYAYGYNGHAQTPPLP